MRKGECQSILMTRSVSSSAILLNFTHLESQALFILDKPKPLPLPKQPGRQCLLPFPWVPGNTSSPPCSLAGSYLLSSQQRGPPVHVILRFDHVHHLIGVQLEFTLQLVQALHILHGLLTVSLLPFLLLLLPTTLTLTDPPQIPANQRTPPGISAHPPAGRAHYKAGCRRGISRAGWTGLGTTWPIGSCLCTWQEVE